MNTRPTSGYHPLHKVRTALSGVSHAVFRDFSVRYKLFISVVFLALAGAFETLFHFLFVLAVTGLMLVAEILNTAIEALCDYVQPSYDQRIKHIKDMAAGATFIAIVIWYTVLGVVLYELLVGTELFSGVVRP
jgi:diacylglycerol kinase